MVINMDETKLCSIAQLQEFLKATPEVSFSGICEKDGNERYALADSCQWVVSPKPAEFSELAAKPALAWLKKTYFVGNSGKPPIFGCFDSKRTCEKPCRPATAYGNHIKAVLRHPI